MTITHGMPMPWLPCGTQQKSPAECITRTPGIRFQWHEKLRAIVFGGSEALKMCQEWLGSTMAFDETKYWWHLGYFTIWMWWDDSPRWDSFGLLLPDFPMDMDKAHVRACPPTRLPWTSWASHFSASPERVAQTCHLQWSPRSCLWFQPASAWKNR